MRLSRLLLVSIAASVAATTPGARAATSDADLIANATSAAPASLAKGATVVAMGAGGKMRVVRAGSNGITCMPADPATPGPSQMCMDANAKEWLGAVMSHAAPPKKVGFMYMLAGGTDASNTDPYASKPVGGKWIATGPHVMIVGPAAAAMLGYPAGPNPDTSKPYTMWGGTPYAHLMIPVK